MCQSSPSACQHRAPCSFHPLPMFLTGPPLEGIEDAVLAAPDRSSIVLVGHSQSGSTPQAADIDIAVPLTRRSWP